MNPVHRPADVSISAKWQSLLIIAALMSLVLVTPHAAGAYETAYGFIYPVGTDWKRFTSGNEYSITQGYCEYRSGYGYHTGLDVANGSSGGYVKAIANGQIAQKETPGNTTTGWGNMVRIRHRLSDGTIWYSQYGHMLTGSILAKNVGDAVQLGETLGQVGSTGASTGPHLHLEIKTSDSDGPGYLSSQVCDGSGFTEPDQFIRDRLYAQGTWWYWDFDVSNDKQGWASWGDCGWAVASSWLIQCQGSDPRLMSPMMDRSVDSKFYVKMIAANLGSRTDGVFYLKTANHEFSESYKTTFTVPNDGHYNSILIRLCDVSGYSSGGNWRQFRIDPVGSNGGANTYIDKIRYMSDTEKPTITSATVDPAGWSSGNSFTVHWVGLDGPDDGTGSGSGIDHYEVQKNGGGWVGQGMNLSWTGTGVVGTNDFQIRAIDNMINVGDPYTVHFYRDPTDPTITSLTSPNPIGVCSTDRTIQVSWSATDGTDASGIDGYSYAFTSSANDAIDCTKDAEGSVTSYTSPSLADGTWYFHLRAIDNAGNCSAASNLGPFIVGSLPGGTPTSCAGSSNRADGINVTWAWSGSGLNGFELKRDGSVVHTGTTTGERSWLDTGCSLGAHGYQVLAYSDCGDGAACSTSGTRVPLGVCCGLEGTCTVDVQVNCPSPGIWQGGLSSCNPNPCAQPGACCDPSTGGCTWVVQIACTAPLAWNGASSCSPNPCAQLGACCDPNTGACNLTLQVNCAEPSNWNGIWTTCVSNPCPQPGACCNVSTGVCSLTLQAGCGTGAIWHNEWTACSPNPCLGPSGGACCDVLACGCAIVTDANDCSQKGTQYKFQGTGIACDPDPCGAMGACCYVTGSCELRSCGQCIVASPFGFAGPGTVCSPEPCGASNVPPIALGGGEGLLGGVPNPSVTSTALWYRLSTAAHVRLVVFDGAGHRIQSIEAGDMSVGAHSVDWDGRGLDGNQVAPGVYFARLDAGNRSWTRTLIRVR